MSIWLPQQLIYGMRKLLTTPGHQTRLRAIEIGCLVIILHPQRLRLKWSLGWECFQKWLAFLQLAISVCWAAEHLHSPCSRVPWGVMVFCHSGDEWLLTDLQMATMLVMRWTRGQMMEDLTFKGCYMLVQMQTEELRAGLDRAEQRASEQLEGPRRSGSPLTSASASPEALASPACTPPCAPERLFREPSVSPAPTPPFMPSFPGTL